MNILKRHCMTYNWKVRQNFLDEIEDSMSSDSLFGSTFRTRSFKTISCLSEMSCSSFLSHDANTSRV
jgi:hypothetical protein